jgi:hypothetical protein
MSFYSLPVSYWKQLDEILKREVPQLYESNNATPIVLNERQFYTASMILNNSKMVPKDYQIKLPDPNPSKKYTDHFEQRWNVVHPNMIGGPDAKTCGNHRMEVLVQTCDFLAFHLPDPCIVSEFYPTIDVTITGFFKALSMFQKIRGNNSLDIFDYCIQGKILVISRRYVASIDEYVEYCRNTFHLNNLVKDARRPNCFWCYQSFIGLTVQGLTKGFIYENPEHIPKAMPEILNAFMFLQIPLRSITDTISNEMFRDCISSKLGSQIYKMYDVFIEEMKKSDVHFELALRKKDEEMVKIAVERYLAANRQESRSIPYQTLLYGADGTILKHKPSVTIFELAGKVKRTNSNNGKQKPKKKWTNVCNK